MKKKIFSLCLFGALVFTLTSSLSEASAKEIFAGATGCLTTPGGNTGKCRQNISGTEYNCVAAGFWDSKDCSSD